MSTSHPIARGLATIVLTGSILLGGAGAGLAVPPAPSNPSDQQLEDGKDAVHGKSETVGSLANTVTQLDQRRQAAEGKVQRKQELAMKARIDAKNKASAADAADRKAERAKKAAERAGENISAMRDELDKFASGSYQQGSTLGGLSAFIGSDGPDDILDRAQMLDAVSGSQLDALDQLEQARTEKANADTAARDALAAAKQKEQAAKRAKKQAGTALATAKDAASEARSELSDIEQRKSQVEKQLYQAKQRLQGLQAQRQDFQEWKKQKEREEAAARRRAAEKAAREAAEEAAAQRAAERRAAERREEARQEAARDSGSGSDSESGSGGDPAPAPAPEPAPAPAPAPAPEPAPQPPSTSEPGASAVQTVINRAKSQLGVRYTWGGGNEYGKTPGVPGGSAGGDVSIPGFDCSGLMIYAFSGAGVSLPHYSGYQYNAGTHVPVSQKQPGDMLFWGNAGIHHVAMYIGNGQMIEAPYTGSHVRIVPVRYDDILPYAARVL